MIYVIFAESFEHSFPMTNGNAHTLNDSMNVEKSSPLGNRGFGLHIFERVVCEDIRLRH